MLEVKTILNKLHRPVRPVSSGFRIKPGMWAQVGTDSKLTNIATDSSWQNQPEVLKLVYNVISSDNYESNDTVVGRVATLEGIFRATVDSDGYQVYDTQGSPAALTYTPGDPLTPAYLTTSTGTSSSKYAAATDIGKLRPAGNGDVVYAIVDYFDGTNLTFLTVSPKPYNADDIWHVTGSGDLLKQAMVAAGTATTTA